jgi:uncharacterized membrane protein YfcA
LIGGGGSILSVPILVNLFSLDVVMASAYSLFVVGSTSMVGAILKNKERLVDVPAGMRLGIPSLIATFCARKWFVCMIPDMIVQIGSFQLTKRVLILVVFALVIIISSLLMIRKRESSSHKKITNTNGHIIILSGLFIGLLSGVVGVGGGFLILPALVLLVGLRFDVAVGTALLIIMFNSFLGFIGDVLNHPVNWLFLLLITSLAIGGLVIGNIFTRQVSVGQLRKSFGWVTFSMGVGILIKEL